MKKRQQYKCWPDAEIHKIALKYNSRSEWQKKHVNSYTAAYSRGKLDEFCQHMVPSSKKNTYIIKTLDYSTALMKVFTHETASKFMRADRGAYYALKRFGVNIPDLYENLDSPEYVKNIVIQLQDTNKQSLVEKKVPINAKAKT
jgi:hypothetical protein